MPLHKDWLELSNLLERTAERFGVPYVDWNELTDPQHISKCIEIAPVSHVRKSDGAVTDTLLAQFVFKTGPREIFHYTFDPTMETFEAALEKFKEHLAPC